MFTMVMLFRLDWDVYMRGLEGWDMGECVDSCLMSWLVRRHHF